MLRNIAYILLIALTVPGCVCSQELYCKEYPPIAEKVSEIISVKPLTKFDIEKGEISFYQEYLSEFGLTKIDTSTLIDLIERSNKIDTTAWTNKELPSAKLVERRNVKNKIVNYYSRPVFDRTHSYAIVAYSYPGTGFGVKLYHCKNGQWVFEGYLTRSSY